MPTTKFNPGTVVQSTWLNDVDSASFPYLTAVTGTNTITATGPQSYVAYTQSQGGFVLMPQASNTGAVTININGLGPVAVTKYGTSPLVASDLVIGVIAYIVYDGTRFQLLNPQTVAARITGRLLNVQRFTANGTYTPTAGTTSIIVEAVGGGGAGGGAAITTAGNSSVGGGGGGGSYIKARFISGFSGSAVVIGAGGVGQLATDGLPGSSTTFGGSLIVCPGGSGGITTGNFAPPLFGPPASGGATPSTTGFLITQSLSSPGYHGMMANTGSGNGGAGGNTPIATGGTPAYQATGGNGALNTGTGGGGCANGASQGTARTGGAGAAGLVIVYEYT